MRDPQPFIAIPVFPSRFFRHSCIYVNAAAGIREPKDLIGKRIGNPEYQMTAPVWIRGILADEYGVPVDSVDLHAPAARRSRTATRRSSSTCRRTSASSRSAPGKTLSEMLADGEIDALHTARMPSTLPRRRRPRAAPVRGLRRRSSRRTTGARSIFPIMHTVVIRREIYEQIRGSRSRSTRRSSPRSARPTRTSTQTAALKAMLPWLIAHVEEARARAGRRLVAVRLRAEPRRRSRRSCATTTSRGCRSAGCSPRSCSRRETLESFRI